MAKSAVISPPGELIEVDVLVRLLGLEEEHLRADQVGHRVVHRCAQEDDALTQQPRIEVVGALAAVRRFDDRRDEVVLGSEVFVHPTTLKRAS